MKKKVARPPPCQRAALRSTVRAPATNLLYSPSNIDCVPKAWAVRIVEITSSARLPPSAVCFKASLKYFIWINVWYVELYAPHIWRNKSVHQGTHYANTREDRWHRQCQTPRANISYYKTSAKRGDEGDDKSHFFWDTLLDKIYGIIKYVQLRT